MNKNHIFLTAIALPAFALPALAQVQLAPDKKTLSAVTVVGKALKDGERAPNLATGVVESSLETPFSATTVSAERVREQAGKTLQDALRNVPGAQADSGFNGSHTQFFILRGAVTDSGTGSNRVLRDGVRLSNYPYVPAFVESIDVLRGPGAAASVRSEPGGTVNLTTRQPKLANFGSVYLGAGTAGAQEMSVDLNRVLSQDDELAARITATRSNGSEWRHVPDQLDGIKLGIARSDGGLRISLAAGHSVRFFVDSGNGGTWTPGSTLLDMRNLQQLGIDSAAPSCHLGWSLGSRPARLRQSANRGHSPKLDDRLFETESGR